MYDKSTVIYNKVTGVYKSVTIISQMIYEHPQKQVPTVTPTKLSSPLNYLIF